jgi:spore maturation protein CgeB
VKILFVGQIWPQDWVSTAWGRMEALRGLGHEIIPVDVCPFGHWGGRAAGLFHRLKSGPGIWRLNREVIERAQESRPDVVWVDKGDWIAHRTLAKLRAAGDPLCIHYTPDPAFTRHNRSRHFRASLPLYDLVVTTKAYELDLYRELGARDILFQYPCFDPMVHRPEEATAQERRDYSSDVAFVGTYAPGREHYLLPLAQAGVDLAIWGNGWQPSLRRRGLRDPRLQRHLRGQALSGRDYALALGCARIGLGILSPLHPDRSTTRSLEIPACATLLLAERTEEHQALFEEGQEAEFFASQGELVEKTRYYLEHDDERRRLAAAGKARCVDSGYTSADRVRQILDHATALT